MSVESSINRAKDPRLSRPEGAPLGSFGRSFWLLAGTRGSLNLLLNPRELRTITRLPSFLTILSTDLHPATVGYILETSLNV